MTPTLREEAKELANKCWALNFATDKSEDLIFKALQQAFTRGCETMRNETLGLVINYPEAWKLDHHIIELQEQVVDETCNQIESAIRFLPRPEYNSSVSRGSVGVADDRFTHENSTHEPCVSVFGEEVTLEEEYKMKSAEEWADTINSDEGVDVVDFIRAIQRDAFASKQSEWQTIDSAPRDGTVILTYNGDIFLLIFGTNEGWFEFCGHDWRKKYNEYRPITHWMPLPPPPQSDANE